MKFSQRMGISPTQKLAQIDSIDDELKNSIWSILCVMYWDRYNHPGNDSFNNRRQDYISGSNLQQLVESLWFNYFKQPIDTIPDFFYNSGGVLEGIRSYYFEAQWFQVYDFMEFIPTSGFRDAEIQFKEQCNDVLERENSAYRFVGGVVVQIASAEEAEEVESALLNSEPYYGAKQHLITALAHLRDRVEPDYRNSIKESISAVESLCKEISGKPNATLSVVLKEIEKTHSLHPALKNAFSSLYGYTSDANGIRHAIMEEVSLSQSDARFMLVSCSAFINYAIHSVEQ